MRKEGVFNDRTCEFMRSSSDGLGEEGGGSRVMQQSRGRVKDFKKIIRKEMGTRGSEGVRREVAESERKIFLEEVASR